MCTIYVSREWTLNALDRDWRDSAWTGTTAIKNGLAEPVREQRNTVFGQNLIDIEGKSAMTLLVDEVRLYVNLPNVAAHAEPAIGYPPLLCIPDCQHCALVSRRLLLLRVLHLPYLCCQYRYHTG